MLTPLLQPLIRPMVRKASKGASTQILFAILTEEGVPLLTEEAAMIQTEPN